MKRVKSINHPDRIHELRQIIEKKKSLQLYYLETYQKYQNCLNRCPPQGVALELGSGGGFVKQVLPEVITSDLIPYEGVDQVIDATHLNFADQSLRAIFLSNVFHHIPDVEAFLKEANRCLLPEGRIFISDPYYGRLSSWIYQYLHHEPFDPDAKSWSFKSSGPLSDANGALAWIVFQRDLSRFTKTFPQLKLVHFQPHSPLRYWLMGGLKRWNLLPKSLFKIATRLDNSLVRLSPHFASFVDIELVKSR